MKEKLTPICLSCLYLGFAIICSQKHFSFVEASNLDPESQGKPLHEEEDIHAKSRRMQRKRALGKGNSKSMDSERRGARFLREADSFEG